MQSPRPGASRTPLALAALLLLPAFAGCLDSGEPAQSSLAASISMAPGELIGGIFQPVEP